MGTKRTRAADAPDPIRRRDHDSREHHELHVAKSVVETLPVRPERPADARKRQTPDTVSDQRQDVVSAERALEEAGGDRNERAGDGCGSTDEDGPRIPPLEPSLGSIELLA